MKGMALVPVKKVKTGTKLICDGGFTCLKDHAKRTIMQRANGELYIRCSAGTHGLDGQLSDDGKYYVGFWLQ